MANVPKQTNHESQGNHRLEDEVCRHEHAEPTNSILTEKASQRVVVWSKHMEQHIQGDHRRDAQYDD